MCHIWVPMCVYEYNMYLYTWFIRSDFLWSFEILPDIDLGSDLGIHGWDRMRFLKRFVMSWTRIRRWEPTSWPCHCHNVDVVEATVLTIGACQATSSRLQIQFFDAGVRQCGAEKMTSTCYRHVHFDLERLTYLNPLGCMCWTVFKAITFQRQPDVQDCKMFFYHIWHDAKYRCFVVGWIPKIIIYWDLKRKGDLVFCFWLAGFYV